MKIAYRLVIIFCVIALAIFGLKRCFYLIGHSDPDFNTVYSTRFKEDQFNDNLIGKNEQYLKKLLGEPLDRYKHSFNNLILYTINKDSIRLNKRFECVCFKNYPQNISYRCFYFDSAFTVRKVKLEGYNEDKKIYLHLAKADILKKFGKPDDEILLNCGNCETLAFSAFSDGMKSGKASTINVREVLLDSNKVVTKVTKTIAGMATNTSCD